MKATYLIILIILLAPYVAAQSLTSFVNDNANILTDEEEIQISSALQSLYNKDLAQIAIVTVNSLDGQPIETVALNLAEGKLGTKDKDNGMLLLIAVEDRAYRFEVGRGLEPIFNDAKVGRYGRDYLVPAFQQGNYGQGILFVINEINKELTGEKLANVQSAKPEYDVQATKIQLYLTFFFVFIVISSFIRAMRSKNKDNKYFWAAVIASQMLRGRGGGTFGRGGFGGFGGGSFGGGGSSGRW